MTRPTRWVSLIVLVACLLSAGACSPVTQGVHVPRGQQASDITRTEAEFIPNAELARESTIPIWHGGRHAFKRGANRPRVFTPFTTAPDRTTPGRTRTLLTERLWVSIPLGTQLGDVLNLHELDQLKLIGYDTDDHQDDHDSYFIQPYRVNGTVTMLEERPDSVVVDVNLLLEPAAQRNSATWRIEPQQMTVPVTRDGVHATRVAPPPLAQYRGEEDVDATSTDEMTDPDGGPVDDADVETDGEQAAEGDVDAVAEAADDETTLTIAGVTYEKHTEDRSINGQWRAWVTRQNKNYEVRMQFSDDGTFVYSTARSGGGTTGYPPGVMRGRYQVKGEFVIWNIQKYDFGGQDHMVHIDEKWVSYRILWHEGKLVLSGNFQRLDNATIVMRSEVFPDMRIVVPPPYSSAEAPPALRQ